MKRKNTTRNALATSIISLLLCVSMLVGTTFAWFTDEVVSANNIIKSGNLDVELYYQVEGQSDWTKVTETTNVFKENTLWEPGHTEVVKLKVVNEGSLALKYTLGVNVANETGSINMNNEEFKLSEYIKFGIVDGAQAYTRDQAVAAVDASATALQTAYNSTPTALAAKNDTDDSDEKIVTMVVYMPTSVGNEANHKTGAAVPTIKLGINLLASQNTVEEDSFDNLYDEPAVIPDNVVMVRTEAELKAALSGDKPIYVAGSFGISETIYVSKNVVITGNGSVISRADGFTGTMFNVASGTTMEVGNVTLDGGAVWNGGASGTNSGVTATGNLIATTGNGNIVLENGAVLQNNDGVNAVSLATRGGGSLTVNGASIINNRSAAGAIWGGGNITINEGSKINGNHATSIGGAIRMVDGYNNITFTMNGGEMNYNTSAGTGGAIWGGNRAKYYLNGGEMAYNSAVTAGGAIWTGTYESYTISGDFKMHDNSAGELGGAIRFSDHASLTMTGGQVYNNTVNGQSEAFYLNNNSASITGGTVSDNFSYSGGLGLTVGEADISGVINFKLSTNHNTAYLAKDFNGFKFTFNESAANAANFNFKPAEGYTYTEGDEAKLICMNDGYETYWDAATTTFRLKTSN